MSQLLTFISSFGSSAELRALTPTELQVRMHQAGLTEAEMAVILSEDRAALTQMIKTSGDIVCLILPSKPEPEEEQPKPDDAPAPEKDEKTTKSVAA